MNRPVPIAGVDSLGRSYHEKGVETEAAFQDGRRARPPTWDVLHTNFARMSLAFAKRQGFTGRLPGAASPRGCGCGEFLGETSHYTGGGIHSWVRRHSVEKGTPMPPLWAFFLQPRTLPRLSLSRISFSWLVSA
jgi:hypothetical protein